MHISWTFLIWFIFTLCVLRPLLFSNTSELCLLLPVFVYQKLPKLHLNDIGRCERAVSLFPVIKTDSQLTMSLWWLNMSLNEALRELAAEYLDKYLTYYNNNLLWSEYFLVSLKGVLGHIVFVRPVKYIYFSKNKEWCKYFIFDFLSYNMSQNLSF